MLKKKKSPTKQVLNVLVKIIYENNLRMIKLEIFYLHMNMTVKFFYFLRRLFEENVHAKTIFDLKRVHHKDGHLRYSKLQGFLFLIFEQFQASVISFVCGRRYNIFFGQNGVHFISTYTIRIYVFIHLFEYVG